MLSKKGQKKLLVVFPRHFWFVPFGLGSEHIVVTGSDLKILRMESNSAMVAAMLERGRFGEEAGMANVLATTFRDVDRGSFFPSGAISHILSEVYEDHPCKVGMFHQSGPHIYAAALLDFDIGEMQRPFKFLVVGSGTGYFSCLVARLCGCNGVIHGIEINEELAEASREAISCWRQNSESQDGTVPSVVEIFSGDGFLINTRRNVLYDRIYIAAGAPSDSINYFADLIHPAGVIIGPFGDQLLKVKRLDQPPLSSSGESIITTETLSHVSFAPLIGRHGTIQDADRALILETAVWSGMLGGRSSFGSASKAFRRAVLAIYQMQKRPFGIVGKLPTMLWNSVLEYCARDWFEPVISELEQLRNMYFQERAARERAELRLEQIISERDEALRMVLRLRLLQTQAADGGGDFDEGFDVHQESSDDDSVIEEHP